MKAMLQEHLLGSDSGSAQRLGVTRALFYAWYLFQVFAYSPVEYARLPESFWAPVKALRFFDAPTPELMLALVLVLSLSAFMACIGLFTRLSTSVTFLVGFFVFGAMNSYGKTNFHFSPMVIMSCILAFSRCGDAFAVDAFRKKSGGTGPVNYCWPSRLGQITLISLMFTAGCQKLSGNWLSQPIHNMEFWLKYKYFAHAKAKGIVMPDILLTVSDLEWLLGVMIIALLCELLSPLALLTRWPMLRGGIIAGLFFMQLSLAVVLKTLVSFPWLGAYLFFVPWDLVIERFKGQPRRAA